MSTTEYLSAIVERVREATKSLSGDDFRLREIAFEKLLEHELGLGHEANGTSQASSGQRSKNGHEQVDGSLASPQMRTDAVARYFDIDPETVVDLFDLGEGVPTLQLPAGKLSRVKAEAVREITLLVCGVRTALGMDTGSRDIRTAAEHYGRLDAGNFMKQLTEFEQIAVRGKPGSSNRLVRMRATGAEASRDLAQRLVSNDR